MGQRWTERRLLCAAGLALVVTTGAAQPLVAGAPTAAASTGDAVQTTNNFWLATASGNLYTFGVPSYGDPGGAPLNQPIVDHGPDQGPARVLDGGLRRRDLLLRRLAVLRIDRDPPSTGPSSA